MSHESIDPKYIEVMNKVAELLDGIFNKKGQPKTTAFCLLITPFGEVDGNRVNYIGNASREDMIVMMKEYIARHEGRTTATH